MSAPPPKRNRAATWINTAVKLSGAGLSLILFVVMARTMTQADFASVSLILGWLAVVTAFASLCMPAVAVRYVAETVAEGRFGETKGVILFALAATLSLSVLLTVLGLGVAHWGAWRLSRDQIYQSQIGILMLSPGILLLVLGAILQGLKEVIPAELLSNTSRPVLLLGAVGLLRFTQGAPIGADKMLWAYCACTVLIVVLCAAYLLRVLPTAVKGATPHYLPKVWVGAAGGFFGVMIASALNERVDLLSMGFVAPAPQVAIYAVATRFVQPLILVAGAASAVMVPQLVEQLPNLRAGRFDTVLPLVRQAARAVLSVCALALIGLWLTAPWILQLFGARYQPAMAPLLILVAGQLGAALFGPALVVATFAGMPLRATACLVLGILTNVALNLSLVPHLGAQGAALGTAVGGTVTALCAWVLVRRRFGMSTAILGLPLRGRSLPVGGDHPA